MSFMNVRFMCTLAVLMVMSLPVWANQDKHAMLETLEKEGYQVDFLGSDLGMDGWVIQDQNGKAQYAYTTPEGALIMGLLFGPDGSIYTAKQVEAMRDIIKGDSQAAAPVAQDEKNRDKTSSAEVMYAEVEAANWFAVGNKSSPYMYTFINPTCIHCVTFWQEHIKPLTVDGALQVRFIPFGSADQNLNVAAGLLISDNADKIWNDYAAGNGKAYDGFSKTPDQAAIDKVNVNTALFRKWKLPAVPFTVYRAPANGEIKIVSGVPTNSMMILADMIK